MMGQLFYCFCLDVVLNTSDATQVTLTANHLQLAAQTPTEWGRSEEHMKEAKAAIKKVAWRAMLEGLVDRERERNSGAMGQSNEAGDSQANRGGNQKRLGRLNDSVYKEWGHFLEVAQRKLEIRLTVDGSGEEAEAHPERDMALESRLEVLQAMRCMMGPVVESWLLCERREWVREELQVGQPNMIECINHFDI